VDPDPDPDPRAPRQPPDTRCTWCSRPLEQPAGAGRRRQYCRQGCRQQAYVARRQSGALELAVDDVVVSRAGLEELAGALYCLAAALDDVETDLADGGDDPREIRLALDWLVDNARPLAGLWLEPRAAGGPIPV
jgi:hypothetical protein